MDACKNCAYKDGCTSINKSDNFVADHCSEKELWEKEEHEWYEQMEMERQAEIDAINGAYVAENYDFDRGDGIY